MSCSTIQSCLSLDCWASSIMFFTTKIGQCVEVPLRTEQLLPFKMFCFLQTTSILSVRILVKIFLNVSNRVISLVLSISLFQSELFGIGIMLAFFQALGVFSSLRM